MTRVQVRRERPTAVAWAIALAVTMLVVYVLTLDAVRPDVVETIADAPRVTREIAFDDLKAYCVSMGQWPNPEDARVEAAGYAAQGAAGCVWQVDGVCHVLGAMYDTERAAKRVADRLNDDGGASAGVICLEAGRVNMRITAPDSQIEAIVAVDAALRGQIQQLGSVALQLDKGEIQPEAARTLCALAGSEAGDAAQALQEIPGSPENALCSALVDAAQALSRQLTAVAESSQSAAPALSGMLRLAQIDAFLRLRELQDGLLNG